MQAGPDERRRILVPWQIGSFLRAPYGWTNKARRAEGWPERGERQAVPLGFWANVLIGLALYGPAVTGAALGWLTRKEWSWVFFGAVIGFAVQILVVIVAAPVVGMVRDRRR